MNSSLLISTIEIILLTLGSLYVYSLALFYKLYSYIGNPLDDKMDISIKRIVQIVKGLKDISIDSNQRNQYIDILTILESYRYLIFLYRLLEQGDRISNLSVLEDRIDKSITLEIHIQRKDKDKYVYVHQRNLLYGGRTSGRVYYDSFLMRDEKLNRNTYKKILCTYIHNSSRYEVEFLLQR